MIKHIPIRNVTLANGSYMPFEKRCTNRPHWCDLKINGIRNVDCTFGTDDEQPTSENKARRLFTSMAFAVQIYVTGASKNPDKIFSLMMLFSSISAFAFSILLRHLFISEIDAVAASCLLIFGIGLFFLHSYFISDYFFSRKNRRNGDSIPEKHNNGLGKSNFLCSDNSTKTIQCEYRTTVPLRIKINEQHIL